MSRFGADPRAFFDGVYKDVPPWDIGGAQPDMAALLADFPPEGPVMDVGCGSGDLAIYLAQGGLNVLGIDFVASAIEDARRKAQALPGEIAGRLEFHVADALQPTLLLRQFGAIVDSGFLHLLTPEESDDFLEEIASVLRPGGRYYLHEFATEFPIPNSPRQVTEQEVRVRFTPDQGWRVRAVRSGEFLSRIAPVLATLACVERLPSPSA
jgi:cyclopropane fatty-acyl-phospholipid synthase-like methyltransferase